MKKKTSFLISYKAFYWNINKTLDKCYINMSYIHSTKTMLSLVSILPVTWLFFRLRKTVPKVLIRKDLFANILMSTFFRRYSIWRISFSITKISVCGKSRLHSVGLMFLVILSLNWNAALPRASFKWVRGPYLEPYLALESRTPETILKW